MAWEKPGGQIAMVATADLSSSQFCAVDADAANDNQVVLPAANAAVLGIVQNKPKAGQAADIMVSGVSKAVAGAAITRGDKVTVNAAGQVVTAATGNFILGRALLGAAASGVLIPVLIEKNGKA